MRASEQKRREEEEERKTLEAQFIIWINKVLLLKRKRNDEAIKVETFFSAEAGERRKERHLNE